jgi:hypothetical protein
MHANDAASNPKDNYASTNAKTTLKKRDSSKNNFSLFCVIIVDFIGNGI